MNVSQTLLLHGFTGGALDWRAMLAQDPTALAIDLPGHGSTPAPSGDFDTVIADLLARLPDSIERLIGYSLGGRIALGLLRAAPQRFRAITLISAHPGLTDPQARAERRAADRHWIERLRRDGIEAFVNDWEAQPLFATQRRLSTDILKRQREQRLAHSPEGLARALEALGLAEMPDTRDALMGFSGTVRWIVGAEDRKFLKIANAICAQRSDAEFHVIERVGHNPLLESPERLSALLR